MTKKPLPPKIKYHDLLAIVIIPPILGHLLLVYDLGKPYGDLFMTSNTGFWLSWASSSGCTVASLLFVALGTRRLDIRYRWRKVGIATEGIRLLRWFPRPCHWFKWNWPRGWRQAALCWIAPLILVTAWNAAFFSFMGVPERMAPYYRLDLPLAAFLLAALNCCYYLAYWQAIDKRSIGGEEAEIIVLESILKKAPDPEPTGVPKLDADEMAVRVAYIKSDAKKSRAHTLKGSDYTINHSLKKIMLALAGPDFCQVRREAIVNHRAIERVEQLPNGQYRIHLKAPHHRYELESSQDYSADFWKWWQEDRNQSA